MLFCFVFNWERLSALSTGYRSSSHYLQQNSFCPGLTKRWSLVHGPNSSARHCQARYFQLVLKPCCRLWHPRWASTGHSRFNLFLIQPDFLLVPEWHEDGFASNCWNRKDHFPRQGSLAIACRRRHGLYLSGYLMWVRASSTPYRHRWGPASPTSDSVRTQLRH